VFENRVLRRMFGQKRDEIKVKGKAVFDFIRFWSVTLVNTIKTTSFTPPSVIKFYLLFRFFSKPSSEGPSTLKRKLPLHDIQLHQTGSHRFSCTG
jgi:hypothetical protein